ncbi:MAG: hypothetical protein ACJ8KU_09115 [Chthoniobacterales bacterium]
MQRTAALVVLCLATLAASANAGARRFTYIYEATTGRPGSIDFENWVTFEAHTPNDHAFREVTFRHELEFGLTEHLQASLYLADWGYTRGEGTRYKASALELIYNFTNPIIDPVALAVYQEYQIGDRFFEWESKVIAQKNIGRLVAAYNVTLEAEWSGSGLSEHSGELQQSLGLSYELHPRCALGLELLHEIGFPEWAEAGRGVFFAGPNVSIRSANWWTTITALGQVTRAGDEPDLQIRTIFGVMF